MKRFIFFRNDRLGDFIIITNLLKSIKKKYPDSNITLVSSFYNHKFIKKYKIIDKVILYNKDLNFVKKIGIFKQIIKDKYYASFFIDGKSFSNFCSIFIKAKYKLGLFYRYKFFLFPLLKPNYLYTFFFDKYETFTSKKFLSEIEHLPSKFIKLGNYLNLNIKKKDSYYFFNEINPFKTKYKNIFKRKFILFHLDEKWFDIEGINEDLYSNLCNFQKKIKKKLVITSHKNNFDYYKNFKKELKKNKNKKIILLENTNLEIMEKLIKYSSYAISCHSGFLVQISGANNSKIIDIINKKDFKWYSCWIPKNTIHKFVFKSTEKIKFKLEKILFDVLNKIKKL